MKKICFFLMVCVLMPFFLAACAREEPSVVFDTTTFDVPNTGGSFKVELTVNYDWTAVASDPWIQVTPSSGRKGSSTLSIRVEANDRSTSRKGSVNINCRDLIRGVSISQMPHLPQSLVIRHTNSEFSIPSLSGSSLSGVVKWGDGIEEKYSASLKHSYSTAGSHTLEINAAGAYGFKLASVAGVSEIDFAEF